MAQPWLSRFLTTRRALKDLSRIATALEQQNTYLARLADKLAPLAPVPDEVALKQPAVSYTRDEEQAHILMFVERVHAATGREPTDEEIVRYLEGEPV